MDKQQKQESFLAFARSVGPWPTSLLAVGADHASCVDRSMEDHSPFKREDVGSMPTPRTKYNAKKRVYMRAAKSAHNKAHKKK